MLEWLLLSPPAARFQLSILFSGRVRPFAVQCQRLRICVVHAVAQACCDTMFRRFGRPWMRHGFCAAAAAVGTVGLSHFQQRMNVW